MFNFLKRKKDKQGIVTPDVPVSEELEAAENQEIASEESLPSPVVKSETDLGGNHESGDKQLERTELTENKGFFKRLKSGLSKTRSSFTQGLGNVVFGKKIIDDELL